MGRDSSSPSFLIRIIFSMALIHLCFPTSLNRFQVRNINKAMWIKISKTSPPIAALEDAQLDFHSSEEPPSINLEPAPSNARVLSGIKISKREIEIEMPKVKVQIVATAETMERPALTKNPPTFDGEKILSSQRIVDTHEYPPAREPKVINFKEIMNKVRGESTGMASPPNSPASVATFITPKQVPPPNPQEIPAMTSSTYEISGWVELHEAAYQPEDRLIVYRELNGRTYESLEVQATRPAFQLKAPVSIGFLVGELRDKNNQIVARGQKWLDRIPKNGQKLSNIVLNLRPTGSGGGRISSASGGDTSNEPVNGARISTHTSDQIQSDETGRYEVNGLLEQSSFIVRAEKKGFANSMMLANRSYSSPVKLYPSKMVSGLIDLAGHPQNFTQKDFSKYGIIWGRVNSPAGEPVENASVEITDSGSIGPIYFNNFQLPDSKLEKTSANGLFAFLRVPKGISIIRANQNGKMMPIRIVPIEPSYVSHVDLESTAKQPATVEVFDAFSRTPISAEVRFAGSPRSAHTRADGLLKMAYSMNSDPFVMEVESRLDYIPTRFHSPRFGKDFFIPMVSSQWMNSLKLNKGPDAGAVLGFISGQKYDVFLDVDGKPHNEIYYFNASGELVSVPVEGGGFIIPNLPNGPHTISIVPAGAPAIYSQVVFVDSSYTSVFVKTF